jgi:hypothetical protein
VLKTVRSNKPSVLTVLKIPVEDQAVCHLLANWIMRRSRGMGHGYMECQLSLMERATPNSPLLICTKAAAMASLANQRHSKALLPLAKACYGHALRQLNAALRDPALAYQDQTLAAVIKLCLYEVNFHCVLLLGINVD